MSEWIDVCALTALTPERGMAALVAGAQVALVRLGGDADGADGADVRAVGHHDPVADANVMARGIVGSRTVEGRQVDVVFSPVHKEAYDLETGASLSEEGVNLGVWPVRVVDGRVHVGAHPTTPPSRPAPTEASLL